MAAQQSRYWWWTAAAARGGASAAPAHRLTLGDWRTPAGQTLEVLGLLLADRVGGDIFDLPNGQGSIIDPASDLSLDQLDITINRIQATTDGSTVIFNRSGTDFWSTGFEGSGAYIDASLYIQTLAGVAVLPVATALDDAGGGFLRFDVPASERALIAGIGDGDRFIVALTVPPAAGAAGDRFLWGNDQFLWGSDRFLWAA